MAGAGAVILLSGGLDSAVTAAIARTQGFLLHAIHFSYGQRHAIESRSARRVAVSMGIDEFFTVTLDLRTFGGSALTANIDVPKQAAVSPQGEGTTESGTAHPPAGAGIPITYVPARNTIFLSYALALAEVRNISDIFIGANVVDYSGYPDCRPAFVAKFEELANLATRTGVEHGRLRVHAPLISLRKSEIILRGHELGVDFSLTHSCYDPDAVGRACGGCESCTWRRKGFEEAGLPDPTIYLAR